MRLLPKRHPTTQPYKFSAKKLQNLRIKGGLTQLELANSANITPSTVSRLENGQTAPLMDSVLRLAWALNREISEFTEPDV